MNDEIEILEEIIKKVEWQMGNQIFFGSPYNEDIVSIQMRIIKTATELISLIEKITKEKDVFQKVIKNNETSF